MGKEITVSSATIESNTTANNTLNGIDLVALRGAIAGIEANPASGMTKWRIQSTWKGGTRTDHAVDGFSIGAEQVDRRFTIQIDEPLQLCGTNQFANPQEYLMSAINACMMVGYSAVAALMGIRLTRLEVELTGNIDLRGFLAIDPHIKPGYDALKQTVRIAGDGTPEQFEQLHEVVKATSPNFFNITTSIPMNSEMVIEQD